MSDQALVRMVEEMEAWLEGVNLPEAAVLERWNLSFKRAVVEAERGNAWPGVIQRAHALAAKLDERVRQLSRQRDFLKGELTQQAVGQRALKAYRQG
jgi:hypothetical protein